MQKNAIITRIVMIALVILVMIIGSVGYTSAKIHDKMQEYLKHKGYTQTEIMNLNVKHSFLNKILSYDEWVIIVKFTDEPDTIYFFTYENKAIIPRGVSGALSKKDFYELNF